MDVRGMCLWNAQNMNILYRPVIFDSLGKLHFRDLGKIGHFGEMERRKTNSARGGKNAQGEKPKMTN